MTTANDAAAFKKIYDARAERLVASRTRAEKWIAGLTALVTVLTTAMVVKGPENLAKADSNYLGAVLVVVILGGVGIAAGLAFAYSAAFGGLFTTGQVDRLLKNPPSVAENAAATLEAAATSDVESAVANMRIAVAATCLGMVCLTIAIGLAWVAPSEEDDEEKVCARVGKTLIEVAETPTIRSGTLTLEKCS